MRLSRFTPGSCLPLDKLKQFKVAIGRDFVDYERIWEYFSTRNLYKKADVATAQPGRPTSATTNFCVPISLLFYRKTAKFLQEYLIGYKSVCCIQENIFFGV